MHFGSGKILFIIILHQSVINSFIKPRVKLNSEAEKIPFQFWSTHRVSRPSLHGTGRFHLVKGEASNCNYTDASCVAHAWADGELINIKCACFSASSDD